MRMGALLHLAIFISCALYTSGEPQCDKLGLLVYEEMGCKPVFSSEGGCPISYDCEKYERSLQHCTFQGKKYLPGEHVDKEILSASCHAGCYCANQTNQMNAIRCATLDCPEYFKPPLESDCFYTYELNKCCANNEIIHCPPFDDLAVCNVDGIEYKEGQRFSPSGTCLKCVCKKGFSGKFEAPFCTKKKCGFEVRHAEAVAQNCAPVYFIRDDENLCCPTNFICPLETDEVKLRENPSKKSGSCKFGSKQIKFDEKIVRSLHQWGKTRSVECVCNVPPLLTCTAPY